MELNQQNLLLLQMMSAYTNKNQTSPSSMVDHHLLTVEQLSSHLPYYYHRKSYNCPSAIQINDPAENECKLIEYRQQKVAAFIIAGETMLCLPQAFDLFLKHFVGGLFTIYAKLKKLNIIPLVCNVEHVRGLRGLGALQPGVNRCKLISCKDFEILYRDCLSSSSRPGRPPKHGSQSDRPDTPQSGNNYMSHHPSAASSVGDGSFPNEHHLSMKNRTDFDYDLNGSEKFSKDTSFPENLSEISLKQIPELNDPRYNEYSNNQPPNGRDFYLNAVKYFGRIQSSENITKPFVDNQKRSMSIMSENQDIEKCQPNDMDDINVTDHCDLDVDNDNVDADAEDDDNDEYNDDEIMNENYSIDNNYDNIDEDMDTNADDDDDDDNDEEDKDLNGLDDDDDDNDLDERDLDDENENIIVDVENKKCSAKQLEKYQPTAKELINYSTIAVSIDVESVIPASINSQKYTSIESLISHIQNLLNVATVNTRTYEKQYFYEKAELKLDALRERELKDSIETKLANETKLRVMYQQRFKKEKRARMLLQRQLHQKIKRLSQMEITIKSSTS